MIIRKTETVMAMLLVLLLVVSSQAVEVQEDQPIAAPVKEYLNFEQIIETAKKRVYPALVFVKPIREEFGSGEKKRAEIFGSGVIISPDGLVVTNNHVAEKAIEINCVLYNKEQVKAEIVGLDKETDLALLRLKLDEDAEPLPFSEFADSDLVSEGQFVMALGAPFGFDRSISLGIIMNAGRFLGFGSLYRYNTWLQTDAVINPGNSGGPLVNTEGKIVGINTLGVTIGGLGFSIPSNVVKDIVHRLERDGKVIRAWTGLRLQALKDFNSNTFIEGDTGVLVAGVEDNSPAEYAGLQAGDVLLTVGDIEYLGKYVEQLPSLYWRLADLPADQKVDITYRRSGRVRRTTLSPFLKEKFEGADFDCRRWNMTVKEISKFINPDLYFHRPEGGLFVQAVRYPGNAAKAGIRRNDIILRLGDTLGDMQQMDALAAIQKAYQRIISDKNREKKVLIEILRDGLPQLIVLDYRKDYDEED
ncbi:MAG: PDZ domain-containing protein [Actinobacteria bacterium]|nr:PDZ domain-containing protein [Actinomycetota bacterium]